METTFAHRQKDRPPPRLEPAILAGRVPPHDLDAEAAVLSAVLLSRDALDGVQDFIKPEHFYSDANGRIFEAACKLAEAGTPIDLVTVSSYLRDREKLQQVGGMAYIAQLADATPSVANVTAHALVVHEKWRVRRLIATCQKIAAEGYGDVGDVQDFCDGAEQAVYELARKEQRNEPVHAKTIAVAVFTNIKELAERGERISGIPTGFERLDSKMGGLHRGDLSVVAARPGMGKTALVMNVATNVAAARKTARGMRPGDGVVVFSLEMPKEQLMTRMVCSESRTDLGKMRNGFLQPQDWSHLAEATQFISSLPMWVDDTPAIDLLTIRSKVRRLQATFDKPDPDPLKDRRIGLVVVDYLQLMKDPPKAQNREQAVSANSQGLKALAKELSVPVIALSQLNRSVETRSTKDKRPQLSDLRECVSGDTVVWDAITGEGVTVRDLASGRSATVYGLREYDWKVAVAPVARAWSTGAKPTYELRTKSGRTIRATANHPFRTIHGWVELEHVAIGSRIAVPRALPQHALPRDAHRADELRLLGYLISDGHYGKHRSVGYVKGDAVLVEDVRRIARERFGVVASDHACAGPAQQIELTVPRCGPQGNPVIEWLKDLGVHGQLGHEKRVPESVFRCNNDLLGIFVGALWSGDGTVTRRRDGAGWNVKFCSTSMGLLSDVQRALVRLGVVHVLGAPTRNSKSTRDIATITVSDASAILRFAEVVELRGAKAERLVRAVRESRLRQRENAQIDRLPLAVTEEVRLAAGDKGMSWRSLGYRCQGKEMSRSMLAKVAGRLGRHDLADLANSEVLWDEVVAIEPAGEEETYDLSVPGMHNFVANGFFVHNSGAIEQDADNILFIYRDEYYNPETSNAKGIAELIVAKQRNGPTGKVLVRFASSCTRFDELAAGDYPDLTDDD